MQRNIATEKTTCADFNKMPWALSLEREDGMRF